MPFDYDTIAQNLALRSHYALGENTLKSQPISISKPIDGTSDLFCYDFDSSCRWYNLDSLLMNDDLDWFRGSGFLDRNRLQISTGTYITPDGSYGIVATDQIKAPNSKATLISDMITCQLGPGELRFMYWISPEVKLTVCLKRTSQLYPNFDFCTNPIRGGSPGPAQISIDDLGNEPFQILIQADNFVFHSANLEGGFAIIDNVEYFGDLCSDATVFPINQDFIKIPQVMYDENEPTESPGMKTTVTIYKSVCDVLQCTFDDNDDQCSMDALNSMWSVVHPNMDGTRIVSNTSNLLYSRGEIRSTAKYTAQIDPYQRLSASDFNLLFTYYKTSNNPKFRIVVKMQEEPMEKTIFTVLSSTLPKRSAVFTSNMVFVENHAPMQKKQTIRWHPQLISLEAGIYDYVAIEIQNLDDNEDIGIDGFLVLDSQKRPMCSQRRNS
uniref:MAM domain-containing protein n=1 Tax=Elaeophora elaphi TaxID=1147741 RepID=A0A158Q8G7_9BILA